ncbi:MAG: hypothetical protein IPQ25_17300, partial [Chitinophagaceae bacterium]|nr:hypothetical protein [Chitinophagaceae bacterium]
LSIYPDKKNNRILAGTSGNGIFIFDTLQQLVKQITFANSNGISISPNCIIKNNAGDYIIFAAGEKQAWKLSSDLSRISTIPISTSLPVNKSGTSFFGNFYSKTTRRLLYRHRKGSTG